MVGGCSVQEGGRGWMGCWLMGQRIIRCSVPGYDTGAQAGGLGRLGSWNYQEELQAYGKFPGYFRLRPPSPNSFQLRGLPDTPFPGDRQGRCGSPPPPGLGSLPWLGTHQNWGPTQAHGPQHRLLEGRCMTWWHRRTSLRPSCRGQVWFPCWQSQTYRCNARPPLVHTPTVCADTHS